MPAITDPAEVGRLLRAIDNYHGHFYTACALKLSALVMLRPGELIEAEWAEINETDSTQGQAHQWQKEATAQACTQETHRFAL